MLLYSEKGKKNLHSAVHIKAAALLISASRNEVICADGNGTDKKKPPNGPILMVAQRLAQAALQRIRMWLTLKCTLVIWCFHLHANEEVEGRRGSVGGWFWVLCDNWVWRRRSNSFDNKTKGTMEIQSSLSVSVFLCLSFFSPKIISLSAVEAQPWGRKEKLTNENRRSAPWTATLLPAASEGKRRNSLFPTKSYLMYPSGLTDPLDYLAAFYHPFSMRCIVVKTIYVIPVARKNVGLTWQTTWLARGKVLA